MQQLFAATLMLTVAVMAADAQAADDKTVHTTPAEIPPSGVRCEPAPAGFSGHLFDPRTESPPRPATRVVPFVSVPVPADCQQPPVGGNGRGRAEGEGAAVGGQSEVPDRRSRAGKGFRWGEAVKQTLLFLSVQHGYALTQPKTRRDLGGNFLRDYARSVRSLHGWADGGRFFTNYVAHPMEGSLLGFVQIQNDPAGSRLKFNEPGYWRSRAKALAWSAAWSTQFEIGPVSQASIGNVGLHGKQTYVDIVMTPTAGLGLLLAEDALDRYVVAKIERRSGNDYVRILSRMALNPTRTAANLLRFKKPWYRDAGLR